MAERERKKKKRSTSAASGPSSMSEEPISSCSEPSISSEASESESAAPSHVSMKSDRSIYNPLNFGVKTQKCSEASVTESAAPSFVSMKSDQSMYEPLTFETKTQRQLIGEPSSCSVCNEDLRDPVHFSCGHWTCKQCVSSEWDHSDPPADYPCPECVKKLRKPQQNTDEDTGKAKKAKHFKRIMQKNKSDENDDQDSSVEEIYTALHITTGESFGLHEEHEVRYFKHKLDKNSLSDVDLNDIFKPLPGQEKPHRTVLTKGVAGIGKSFAVQKFVRDWAQEEANLDIDFVFSFAFRELNLTTDEKSLLELLTEFHPAPLSLKDTEDFVKDRVLVILDGLDESRLQLDFENCKKVTSPSEVTSVDNLLTNLIQGNLLPNAKIWITSRPAAANQIPAEYIDMVTEIRGFNDPQKEEYFRRRFSQDLSLADSITSHIQSSESLDIMCHIPIFCWISAVLFEEVFGGDEKAESPQTLTEMMAHFLFVQTKRRSRKYDQKTEKNKEQFLKSQKEFLMKLGKLAFDQLLQNNLIFYEEDFEGCGINITEAVIYSGFCNTVLREEKMFSQKKVFFFVHLTIQEFLAALYVYDCFTNKKTTELSSFLDLKQGEHSLLDLLKMTVDKVLEEKNGHLDFFLRFLFGLLVESNRRVIQGLLTSPDPSQDTDKKVLSHLKAIRRKTLSPDSCINLFQTMVEMRDNKVKDEIQEYLRLSDQEKKGLTPLHCSAAAYMLQVSKSDVEVLDLKSYNTSDEGRRRLIPAVRSSKKAILADCKVTAEWVKLLAFGLKFPYSPLRDLDLSNNDLKDSGVEFLCEGLSSQWCKLKKLRLSGCQITEIGCASLVSALKSNPSHLEELDLSYNHPGDSGVKQLSDLKDEPHYKLNDLNIEHGGSHRMKPGFKKYARKLTLDPKTAHKNLRLSEGNRKVTRVKEEQSYPDDPERFDLCPQVLCKEGLNQRCYLEVEVDEPFNIGVTYKTISRKGDVNDCKLGQNDKSWSLVGSDDGCYVMHNNKSTSVGSLCSRSSRLGVYLDWPAGTLSFYRVSSDSRTHLHTFKAEFSEPLYPAVEFVTQSSALFCQLT
ncbi:NACHT, LRR and PYD domains-containing protein 12-like [Scomber japonicus]|uniref:NACHT, LRR and PYD domains-containing protein 12-like n=1 Tax=Scomber japonicus TaxID=13676 RepID=UPI002306D70E|nr:NACHT, LRR and PYD domains-containing protein 12-like [Scomber japonicus]